MKTATTLPQAPAVSQVLERTIKPPSKTTPFFFQRVLSPARTA
jgi:hypothetical protein